MNLNLANLPLPLATNEAGYPCRRHRLGNLELASGALGHFRDVADALDPDQPVPGVDAIATAARALFRQFSSTSAAPCIRLRMRCLAAMRAMAADPDWRLDPLQQRRIALIARYASDPDGLIPDGVPVIGGLDDALLVDLAWPSLRGALDEYLDFRRVRAEEAMLLGVRPHEVCYDSTTWQQARIAEQAWRTHVAQRGQNSYLAMSAPNAFRIH